MENIRDYSEIADKLKEINIITLHVNASAVPITYIVLKQKKYRTLFNSMLSLNSLAISFNKCRKYTCHFSSLSFLYFLDSALTAHRKCC